MSTTYFTKAVLLLTFLSGCCFCCFAGPVNHDDTQTAKRVKRNLIQFGIMITCATRRNPFDYNNYGCYCGWGGGGNPLDDTDRCCQIHDACYGQISKDGICGLTDPKYVLYVRSRCTRCARSNNNCQSQVCECDGAAARCFARSHYNPANKGRCNQTYTDL